jgi:flavin reductase (DIM6/NTAB) family NADH-FMN oxidoreductase RutF
MRRFPTGVTVVTTRGEEDRPMGLTVSAFTSVSLDPVLVLVCIHRDAGPHDSVLQRRSYAVNVLAADQAEVAIRFATGAAEDRFKGLTTVDGPLGNPLLPDALAWLDCRVTEVYPGGDHSVVLGEVVAAEAREGEPLLFHQGALGGFRR